MEQVQDMVNREKFTVNALDMPTTDLINEWVFDEQWRTSLLADRVLSPELEALIAKTAKRLEGKIAETELNQLLQNLQSAADIKMTQAENQTDPSARWHDARVAYAHYSLAETVIEGSQFSEAILANMQAKLGDDYLTKLALVDRYRPSELTDLDLKEVSSTQVADLLKIPEVRLYLLLKHWQDKQHGFHEDNIFPRFKTAREKFENWIKTNQPYLSENASARDALILLENIYAKQPVDIQTVAKLIKNQVVSEDTLVKFVGGKAIGLAKLLSVGARVPATYVLPVHPNPQQLDTVHLFDEGEWAVRSSATVEDGHKAAFAGIFKSFLGLSNTQIAVHYQQVLDSLNTPRAKQYVETFKTAKPEMAVLVQEFREPEVSGVWLGSKNGGQLEWVEGRGEKLVSGQITPTHEDWDEHKSTTSQPISSKDGAVGKLCLKLQSELGVEADFEFCLIDGELVWLQFRPVTQALPNTTAEYSLTNGEIQGRAASVGQFEGIGFVAEDPDEIAELGKENVLICDVTDPDWLPAMLQAGAILTVDGGALSHAAITARELGLPAVVGAGKAVLELHGKKLTIDGATGRIKIQP